MNQSRGYHRTPIRLRAAIAPTEQVKILTFQDPLLLSGGTDTVSPLDLLPVVLAVLPQGKHSELYLPSGILHGLPLLIGLS